MEKIFGKQLDNFLLNNPNCTQDEREELMELLNKFETKVLTIKFRNPDIDTEEVRECLEDGLGVEILEIE